MEMVNCCVLMHVSSPQLAAMKNGRLSKIFKNKKFDKDGMKSTQPLSRDGHKLILFQKVEPHDPECPGFDSRSHIPKTIGQKRQGLMARTCSLFKIITSDVKAYGKKKNSQWVLYVFFSCAFGVIADIITIILS